MKRDRLQWRFFDYSSESQRQHNRFSFFVFLNLRPISPRKYFVEVNYLSHIARDNESQEKRLTNVRLFTIELN